MTAIAKHQKTEYQNQVIQKIRTLRHEHHISQVILGDIMGITSGQVGNIESLRFPHKFTLKQIYKFCQYIGGNIGEIFGEANETTDIDTIIRNIIRYGE